jgi:hypothetical protein
MTFSFLVNHKGLIELEWLPSAEPGAAPLQDARRSEGLGLNGETVVALRFMGVHRDRMPFDLIFARRKATLDRYDWGCLLRSGCRIDQ